LCKRGFQMRKNDEGREKIFALADAHRVAFVPIEAGPRRGIDDLRTGGDSPCAAVVICSEVYRCDCIRAGGCV
jgi:hypothetical protein